MGAQRYAENSKTWPSQSWRPKFTAPSRQEFLPIRWEKQKVRRWQGSSTKSVEPSKRKEEGDRQAEVASAKNPSHEHPKSRPGKQSHALCRVEHRPDTEEQVISQCCSTSFGSQSQAWGKVSITISFKVTQSILNHFRSLNEWLRAASKRASKTNQAKGGNASPLKKPADNASKKVCPAPSLMQPVSFELNCQLLRGFGPPIMLSSMATLDQL